MSTSHSALPTITFSPPPSYSSFHAFSDEDDEAYVLSSDSPNPTHPSSPTSSHDSEDVIFDESDKRLLRSETCAVKRAPMSGWRTRSRSKATLLLLVVLLAVALICVVAAQGPEEVKAMAAKHVSGAWNKMSEWTTSGYGDLVDTSLAASHEEIDTSKPTIPISTRAKARLPILDDETKYIGYVGHSGFHNQRMELENALLLGKILNRTVLIPPVWVGWPTATELYPSLQKAWTTQMLMSPKSFGVPSIASSDPLNIPGNYQSSLDLLPNSSEVRARVEATAKSVSLAAQHNREKWEAKGFEVRPDGYPVTNLTAKECKSYSTECRHTYQDTFLSWGSLVDLEQVAKAMRIVDRWDVRERALEELLNVKPDDFFVLEDSVRYDFKFVPHRTTELVTDNTDGSNWAHYVSLPLLQELPQRVLLVGSLFGSGRVYNPTETDHADRELISQSMAFRNSWLVGPADAIRYRLGGSNGYVGVHARVGDGGFLRGAAGNMQKAWSDLVGRLAISDEAVAEVWAQVKPPDEQKRSLFDGKLEDPSEWAELDGEWELNEAVPTPLLRRRRFHDRRSVPSGLLIRPRLHKLQCRRTLHSAPALLALNVPVYLATDSRDPATDPHLAIFYRTFPCLFTLSDFDRPTEQNGGEYIESVGDMLKLVNEADGVGLGRLFLPFLEAVIAAKGETTVGTSGSTFSAFASGSLHRAYRKDSKWGRPRLEYA